MFSKDIFLKSHFVKSSDWKRKSYCFHYITDLLQWGKNGKKQIMLCLK